MTITPDQADAPGVEGCDLAALATRVEQIEAKVKRCREIIRKHKEKTDRAVEERDEALAEVERLTAERMDNNQKEN